MAYFKLSILAAAFCLAFSVQAEAMPAFPTSPTQTDSGEIRLNSPAQREADRANTAIRNCDEDAYNRALNNLREQQENLEHQADSKPNMFFNPADAAQMAVNIKFKRDVLAKAWTAAQPCGGQEKETQETHAAVSPAHDHLMENIECEKCTHRVEDAQQMAEEAIAECNRGKFLDAMDWLDDIAYGVPTPKGEEAVDRVMDDLERQWRAAGNKKTCYGLAYPTMFEWITGADVGISHLHDGPSFLGLEDAGNNRTFGVLTPKTTGTSFVFDNELRINLGESRFNLFNNLFNFNNTYNEPSPLDIFLGLRWEQNRFRGVANMFEPGADTLLLPGVGAGPNPSGFFLVAPNGTVDSLSYKGDYDNTLYRLGLGRTSYLDALNSKVRWYGGFEYGHSQTKQVLMGSLADVGPLDFYYDTKINNDVYAPFVGADFTARPEDVLGSNAFGLPVELSASFRYALDFNDADGRDMLSLQGFTPGTANIEKNQITHNFRADLGLTFNPYGAFSVEVGGGYEYKGNNPTISRDGTDLSHLNFDGSSDWRAGLTGRIKF